MDWIVLLIPCQWALAGFIALDGQRLSPALVARVGIVFWSPLVFVSTYLTIAQLALR